MKLLRTIWNKILLDMQDAPNWAEVDLTIVGNKAKGWIRQEGE